MINIIMHYFSTYLQTQTVINYNLLKLIVVHGEHIVWNFKLNSPTYKNHIVDNNINTFQTLNYIELVNN